MAPNKNKAKASCHQQGKPARRRTSGKSTVNSNRGTDTLPAAQNVVQTTKTPVLSRSAKSKGTIVKHREFIDNIVGDLSFGLQSYAINPGLPISFPWLNATAANYEKYKVRKFQVDIQTNVGSNVGGTYGMAIDFDANDGPPISEQELMAFEGAVNCAVWNSCRLDVSRFNRSSPYKELYVRTGDVEDAEDKKTYDLGTLYVYTIGTPDTSLIGKIYYDYEIEFFNPQVNNFGNIFAKSAEVDPIAPLRAAPFGTAGRNVSGGLEILFLDAQTMALPVGSYLMVYNVTGTVVTVNLPSVVFNPSVGGIIRQTPGIQSTNGAAATSGEGWFVLEVYNATTEITVDFTASMGSLNGSQFLFASYSATPPSVAKARRSELLSKDALRRKHFERAFKLAHGPKPSVAIRDPDSQDPEGKPETPDPAGESKQINLASVPPLRNGGWYDNRRPLKG